VVIKIRHFTALESQATGTTEVEKFILAKMVGNPAAYETIEKIGVSADHPLDLDASLVLGVWNLGFHPFYTQRSCTNYNMGFCELCPLAG